MLLLFRTVIAFLGKYDDLCEFLKSQSNNNTEANLYKNKDGAPYVPKTDIQKQGKEDRSNFDTKREKESHEGNEKDETGMSNNYDEENSVFVKKPKSKLFRKNEDRLMDDKRGRKQMKNMHIDNDQRDDSDLDITGMSNYEDEAFKYLSDNEYKDLEKDDGISKNAEPDEMGVEKEFQIEGPHHTKQLQRPRKQNFVNRRLNKPRSYATRQEIKPVKNDRINRFDGDPQGLYETESQESPTLEHIHINFDEDTRDMDYDNVEDDNEINKMPRSKPMASTVTDDNIITEYKEYYTPHNSARHVKKTVKPKKASKWRPKIKKIIVPGKPREVCVVKVIPIPVDKNGYPLKRRRIEKTSSIRL